MSRARKILLSNARPGRRVTLQFGEEVVEVEVRQPSLAVKGAAIRAAGGSEGVEPDLTVFVSELLASCVYEPGTTKRVFNRSDVPELVAAGPEFDELQKIVLETVQGDADLGNGSAETSSSAHS